jgi:hypothetical protein
LRWSYFYLIERRSAGRDHRGRPLSPGPFSEQTGHFSSLRAPSPIEAVEIVQVVVGAIAVILSFGAIRARAR